MPAQVQFLDGTLCNTARYVFDLSNDAAASMGEFTTPFLQAAISGDDTLVHEVQPRNLKVVDDYKNHLYHIYAYKFFGQSNYILFEILIFLKIHLLYYTQIANRTNYDFLI